MGKCPGVYVLGVSARGVQGGYVLEPYNVIRGSNGMSDNQGIETKKVWPIGLQ